MCAVRVLAGQLKLRSDAPTWGFKVEVRAWSPAAEGDSFIERMRRSIGGLMARYSATLVMSIPLSADEVKLQRHAAEHARADQTVGR